MDFNKEEWIDQLEKYPTEYLGRLHELTSLIIDRRTIDADQQVSALFFSQLRSGFNMSGRLNEAQIASLKPWAYQSRANKEAFMRALGNAIKFFEDGGWPDSQLLRRFILTLVINSSFFNGVFSYALIIKSLNNIRTLMEEQHPMSTTKEGWEFYRGEVGNVKCQPKVTGESTEECTKPIAFQ
jgi:hypothetical protein